MKIKMLTLQAGPNGVRNPGEVHDVSPAEAEELLAGGYAVKVDKAVTDEPVKGKARTATRTPGRTAARTKKDAPPAKDDGDPDD